MIVRQKEEAIVTKQHNVRRKISLSYKKKDKSNIKDDTDLN